jgi:hypothetical protein
MGPALAAGWRAGRRWFAPVVICSRDTSGWSERGRRYLLT